MTNKTDAGYEEGTSITRIPMRFVGVWSLDDGVVVWPICKFLAQMLPLFFLNVLPQTAIESRDDFSLVLDVVTTVGINGFIAFVKTLTLRCYRVEVKTLAVQIRRDWVATSAEELNEVWSNARLCKWILRFFTLSSFNIIIVYTVEYLINYESNVVRANSTIFRPLNLKLICPSIQTHESLAHEIIGIGQCVGEALSVIGFAVYDELYVSAIIRCSEQLFNLKQRMQNLANGNWITKNPIAEWSRPLIQRHSHLVSYADIYEDIFNKPFLVQVFVLFVGLRLRGYQFVMLFSMIDADSAFMIFPIFFTASNLGNIFAQIIPDESLSGIYQIEWIELTVNKFSALALEYIARIMKKFVKCLSVLLAVKDNVVD